MSKNHTQKLKFQFESDLEYQKKAIESIVDISLERRISTTLQKK
jgi:hypothetical protein